MERVKIQQILENVWLGAEYGITVSEILAKSEIFSIPMWDPRAENLFDLDLTDERNLSIISYYQLLQECDAVQQEIAWTSTYLSQKSVLSNLINMAKNAGAGGDMALACIFSNSYSHAFIAYDVTYGAWDMNGSLYDGRILIADPYLDDFSEVACLYFNSSDLSWCIPMWALGSDDENCFIGLASASLDMMNNNGYFSGTYSYASDHPFVPIIEVPADAGSFIIAPIGDTEEDSVMSTDLNWFSTIASYVSAKRAGLSTQADGFYLYSAGNDTISYQMSFEKYLMNIHADKADYVSMMNDGTVSLTGNESSYEISITTESVLPWDRITFSGSGCSTLEISHTGRRITLNGDCLAGMTIVADNEEYAVSKKINPLSDGSIFTAAEIYPDSDGNIQILVDLNNDGECETLLTDEPIEPASVKFGDINLDSDISLLDVVALNRYLTGSVMLNEEALANADCDESLRINALDSMLILKYIVEAVPALPLSKAQEMMGETE